MAKLYNIFLPNNGKNIIFFLLPITNILILFGKVMVNHQLIESNRYLMKFFVKLVVEFEKSVLSYICIINASKQLIQRATGKV